MVAKLYVARHGETEWSLSGRHTGRTDIPLTTHGDEEARRLASALARVQFWVVLCSPASGQGIPANWPGLGPWPGRNR